jgi:hypothetical protein
VLLIPLAATSNQWSLRKLGGRKWQELHRNIYLISILACVHYFWLVKASALLWPLAYSLAVGLLLGWRIRERRRKAIPVPQFQQPNRLNSSSRSQTEISPCAAGRSGRWPAVRSLLGRSFPGMAVNTSNVAGSLPSGASFHRPPAPLPSMTAGQAMARPFMAHEPLPRSANSASRSS